MKNSISDMIISNNVFHILCGLVFLLSLLIFISLAKMFYTEKNKLGLRRSFFLLLISSIVLFLVWISQLQIILLALIGLIFLAGVLFILPFKAQKNITSVKPLSRIDERNIMFSRKELIPGTKKFNEYYNRNPENKIPDDIFRKEPGLLAKGTRYYHENIFQKAHEAFSEVEILHSRVAGDPANTLVEVKESEITQSIKASVLQSGALDVGICLVEDYHFYSIKGRGEDYNRKIDPHHKFAIAFTVEMDFERVNSAPQAPIVLESATQYLNSGRIAVDLAEKIRDLGYDARAHIDGNYEVVCPLVARDAGLGEIGRMGLLMTPSLGPRVRIAVVTTNLELIPDKYSCNDEVIEFCKWCKKCSNCCPGNSISNSDPETINGVKRWQIDQESCYTFWCKAGTDCGRCMAVCPYSHPNHGFHKMIRYGIRKSRLFRYIAVFLDDFFYGRKPKPGRIPDEFL